eukprot:CAMPEP_0117514184 /NCGR_PEP_ID=MMETSP0784-20121206/29939_1 /TAXON_ID=39447 /ORGANISM="" /LENGTH=991 /DNA_ID=CAMNT_0005309973 /DNA_START=44 /DNA_END=3015 /DNA_ORIENTATION=+
MVPATREAEPLGDGALSGDLVEVVATLRSWSEEGPPRNPRASAGRLLDQVRAAMSRRSETAEDIEARARAEASAECQRDVAHQASKAAEAANRAAEVAAMHADAKAECELFRLFSREWDAMTMEDFVAGAIRASALREASDREIRLLHREVCRSQEENASLREANASLHAKVRESMPPVTVMCRVRPTDSYEGKDPDVKKQALTVDNSEISLDDGSSRQRKFRVSRVLDEKMTQSEVFTAAEPLVDAVANGGSACIFAYGATGSGKTYTMQGGQGKVSAPGLAHHALRRLVEGPGCGPLQLSMLEVYCDSIRDLLAAGAPDAGASGTTPPSLSCSLRDAQGRMVLDCVRCDVATTMEAEDLLHRGFAARAAGGTLCNERSSRSHVLLFARSVRASTDTAATRNAAGQLVLVDLAGSENVQKSGADEDTRLLTEAKAINRSLSALADVVEATAKRQQFVPYRNSKLTMLLEEALTHAKVLMMVHVSPLARDVTDTAHSLTFAGRVQAVDFGAHRLRVEQEERMRSNQLRKDKETLENRVSELQQQVRSLSEQNTRLRDREPQNRGGAAPLMRKGSGTAIGPEPLAIAAAPVASIRAYPETSSRSVANRVPTPPARPVRNPRPRPHGPIELVTSTPTTSVSTLTDAATDIALAPVPTPQHALATTAAPSSVTIRRGGCRTTSQAEGVPARATSEEATAETPTMSSVTTQPGACWEASLVQTDTEAQCQSVVHAEAALGTSEAEAEADTSKQPPEPTVVVTPNTGAENVMRDVTNIALGCGGGAREGKNAPLDKISSTFGTLRLHSDGGKPCGLVTATRPANPVDSPIKVGPFVWVDKELQSEETIENREAVEEAFPTDVEQIEKEIEKVRGQKVAASDAEDYDTAYSMKVREKKLLEHLDQLKEANPAAVRESVIAVKPALKKGTTNFTQRNRQRLGLIFDAHFDDEARQGLSDGGGAELAQANTRRVHFDDEAPMAKTPPKWYLDLWEQERR